MKLLAIETSTDACSIGLMVNDEIIVDHRLAAQQHGALVLPMVNQILADAGINPNQLDGIAYGRGPGSFTGVRIGVAVTQGIALGADIGVTGISTLQSIAQGCLREYSDRQIAVSVDARMDEVYFCAFESTDAAIMQAVCEERVCTQLSISELPESPGSDSNHWHWAGSGADRYADIVKANFSIEQESIRPDCRPQATDLLSLALPYAIAGELVAPEYASPVYLRDKVAQTTAERQALID